MTGATDMTETKVTQADRDLFKKLCGSFGPEATAAIDSGDFDHDSRIQSIARHREAGGRGEWTVAPHVSHLPEDTRVAMSFATKVSTDATRAAANVGRGRRDQIERIIASTIRLEWHGHDHASIWPRSVTDAADAILSALRQSASDDYRRGIEKSAAVLDALAAEEDAAVASMYDSEVTDRVRCALIARELRRAAKKVRALLPALDGGK